MEPLPDNGLGVLIREPDRSFIKAFIIRYKKNK